MLSYRVVVIVVLAYTVYSIDGRFEDGITTADLTGVPHEDNTEINNIQHLELINLDNAKQETIKSKKYYLDSRYHIDVNGFITVQKKMQVKHDVNLRLNSTGMVENQKEILRLSKALGLSTQSGDDDQSKLAEKIKKLEEDVKSVTIDDSMFRSVCTENINTFQKAVGDLSMKRRKYINKRRQLKAELRHQISAIREARDRELEYYRTSKSTREELMKRIEDFNVGQVERLNSIQSLKDCLKIVCGFSGFRNADECKQFDKTPDVSEPLKNTTLSNIKLDTKLSLKFEKQQNSKSAASILETNGSSSSNIQESEASFESSKVALAAHMVNLEKEAMSVLALLRNSVDPSVKLLVKSVLGAIKQGDAKRTQSMLPVILKLLKQIESEDESSALSFSTSSHMLESSLNRLEKAMDVEIQAQIDHYKQHSEAEVSIKGIDAKIKNADEKSSNAVVQLQEELKRCRQNEIDLGMKIINKESKLNLLKMLKSALRTARTKIAPNCGKSCAYNAGVCIWSNESGKDVACNCHDKLYGSVCTSSMCPGFGSLYYKSTQRGVCSNRGKCDDSTGQCSCDQGYRHGPAQVCEYKICPGDSKCGGPTKGQCNPMTGLCECIGAYSGETCEDLMCPGEGGALLPATSQDVCNGEGACNSTTGVCACGSPFFGKSCEFRTCEKDCNGRGTCDTKTGNCVCQSGYHGPTCQFKECEQDCNGGGRCDRLSGKCHCDFGFSGNVCLPAERCDAKTADWWTSFDHAGWSLCPPGHLIVGIYTNFGAEIFAIEMAACAKPCEGDVRLKLVDCFHRSWYNTFNQPGQSVCSFNHFIAGFYRSDCAGLSCIELAKCCQIERSRWSKCDNINWSASFGRKGWSMIQQSTLFLTGLIRQQSDNLDSVTGAVACGFRRDWISTSESGPKKS